jgi:sugar phosphate isomerase/epimerase
MRLCAFADEASTNLDGQIEALKRNNISLLEIRGVDGQNIKEISYEKIKEIKARLDENGISVWSIGSPVGKYNPDENFEGQLEEYKRLCEYAKILGAKRIRMFSFFSKDEGKVMERLEVLSNATPDGIIMCHENEKGIFGDDAESCVKICEKFPKVRAVFDPANFVQCDVDTLDAWQKLEKYVDYMHIKDALKTKQVVPCGKGYGNLKYLIGEYAKNGGEVLTLEPHLMEFYGLSDLENGESLSLPPVFSVPNVAFDAGVKELKEKLESLNWKY